MEQRSVPPEQDREFRPPHLRAAGDSRSVYDDYQRLVANPFLGLVALGLWLYAARYTILYVRELGLLAAILLLLAGAYLLRFLFHYHCLDCGATGLLQRYNRHCCQTVQDRYRAGKRTRLRPPNPVIQAVLWVYIACAAAMIFADRF